MDTLRTLWLGFTDVSGYSIIENLETWLLAGFAFWLIFIKIVPAILNFFGMD